MRVSEKGMSVYSRGLKGLFKVLCLRFEVAPETEVTLNFGHRTLNTPCILKTAP